MFTEEKKRVKGEALEQKEKNENSFLQFSTRFARVAGRIQAVSNTWKSTKPLPQSGLIFEEDK